MGVANLRSVMAVRGLAIEALTLRYADEKGATQIIEAKGRFDDGTPFDATSAAFAGDPVDAAAAFAAKLVTEHKVKQVIHSPELTQRIAASAEAIGFTANVAKAIVEEKKRMSLADKFAAMTERVQAVPKALAARADDVIARLLAVETNGGKAMDGIEAHVAQAEGVVTVTENAVRQISNGPLSGSDSSQKG